MHIKTLVKKWFEVWESGDFQQIPIAGDFEHISPYGTVKGKKDYLSLVVSNKDKFLGHRFEIHDEIYEGDKACIRYTAIQGTFTLEVSEWHYAEGDLIKKITAYYNIDEKRIEID